MFLFRPPWWFVGHPDWPEVTRRHEREHGELDAQTRRDFKRMRDEWDRCMGYNKQPDARHESRA